MSAHLNNVQSRNYFLSLLASFLLVFFFSACGEKSQEGKGQTAGDISAKIMLDKIAVAMVPGGWESITVVATDENGVNELWQAESENEGVAKATVTASQVTVKGVEIGETDIRIKSLSGAEKTVPVKVYSPMYLDVGDLTLAFVDNFTFR